MLRVYKTSRFPFFLGFLILGSLIFLGLPFFLLLLTSFLIITLIRTIFMLIGIKSAHSQRPRDPNVSAIIKNKRIGDYRIKKSERDPNTIEVIQE
jgi:hypothetical protein